MTYVFRDQPPRGLFEVAVWLAFVGFCLWLVFLAWIAWENRAWMTWGLRS